MPRRGNLDKRAIITEKEQGWLCGTGCLKISLSSDVVSPEYFYYYLSQKDVVEYIEGQAVGSTLLNLSASIVEGFEIRLPPISNQNRIAQILWSYDDLIENYNSQIRLLESSAQNLYREWFVRGRCPFAKYEGTVEFPVGWKKVKFTEIASVLSGGTPKTDNLDYWNGDIYWLSPADFDNRCYILSTAKTITDLGLKSCNSKHYPINTVIITARGTVGKVVLLGRPMAINQSNYALVGNGVSQFFIYFKTLELVQKLKQEAIGAVFETITIDNFERTDIVLPTEDILEKFDAFIEPYFSKIRNLLEQTEKLRQMRDKLLPRLLSGQIPLE